MEETQDNEGLAQGCVVVYAVALAGFIVLITMIILFTALFSSGAVQL